MAFLFWLQKPGKFVKLFSLKSSGHLPVLPKSKNSHMVSLGNLAVQPMWNFFACFFSTVIEFSMLKISVNTKFIFFITISSRITIDDLPRGEFGVTARAHFKFLKTWFHDWSLSKISLNTNYSYPLVWANVWSLFCCIRFPVDLVLLRCVCVLQSFRKLICNAKISLITKFHISNFFFWKKKFL